MVDGIVKIEMWGEEVKLMVTPRLCIYNGRENASLSMGNMETGDNIVSGGFGFSYGADVLYCSALNYWDLSGNDLDKFPYHRIDFHRWAFENQRAYMKAAQDAIRMLSAGNGDDEGSKKK